MIFGLKTFGGITVKGIYLIESQELLDRVYSKETQLEIASLIDMSAGRANKAAILENPALYGDIDIVLSTWTCPKFDSAMLDIFSNLKIIFYGAGSIKAVVSDSFWNKGLRICSAWGANGVPVAHFTVAQILYSLKLGWYHMENYKNAKKKNIYNDPSVPRIPYGTYRSTVGIISLGIIGQMVIKLLQPFELNIIAFDPYVSQEKADRLGLNVKMCSLDEVFSESDVVSLHTPLLAATIGMIEGRYFELMKPSSTFINTSRGAIIKEEEMIEVLKKRPDIYVCLDVTSPEPPKEDSPLFELPNVVLTPHIAGSMGRECARMGDYMLKELKLYLNNEPLKWEVDKSKAAIMA